LMVLALFIFIDVSGRRLFSSVFLVVSPGYVTVPLFRTRRNIDIA
jgi:hypothetical protein